MVVIPMGDSTKPARKLGVWIGKTIYKIKIINREISRGENDFRAVGNFIFLLYKYCRYKKIE
jgi:hypothetical protein